MTKTVKVLALVMALVTVACLFVSCGPISGTYVVEGAEDAGELKFSGKNVTMTTKEGEETYTLKGTYELNDEKDKITFTFDADKSEGEGVEEAVKFMNELLKEVPFEKGDDYIKIAGTKYVKK